MKTKEEKGVTLIALVTTLIVLLILVSIGTTVGKSTIDSTKFSQFKTELKILQTKVNELNQEGTNNLGTELSEKQKEILNLESISNIIYSGKTDKEKEDITKEFKYFNKDTIKDIFNLDNIKREYLINIKYRYIIYPNGYEYENNVYYMINQIDSEIYNVNYKKQDYTTGNWDFEVEYEKEDNRWKIQVSNITYNGEVYDGKINNWKIEYRNNDEDYWKNANGKKFYVTKSGNYYIRISFEEINIGPKLISILNDENIEEDI